MYYSTGSKMADCGLIEAYWNVNKPPKRVYISGKIRFNRSILKCKFFLDLVDFFLDSGLIEAYWNVNKCETEILCEDNIGLIEAYWNVNENWIIFFILNLWV